MWIVALFVLIALSFLTVLGGGQIGGFLTYLFSALIIGLIGWMLFRFIKGDPDAFSKANFSKSFGSMGVLAIILMCLIGIVVFMLRNS